MCGISVGHTQDDETGDVQQEWQCISDTYIGRKNGKKETDWTTDRIIMQ
jgi:hypothetical protein